MTTKHDESDADELDEEESDATGSESAAAAASQRSASGWLRRCGSKTWANTPSVSR